MDLNEQIAFKLSAFEGPLDLLLHLISQSKVDIKDIFVSEITEQYLAYLAQMRELDMDVASEFVAMAATLLNIKSRSLLPKPVIESDEEDPEQLLIQQLQEYQRIKAVCGTLQQMEAQAGQSFYKLPEEFAFQPDPLNLEGVEIATLFAAMQEILSQHERRMQPRQERVNVIRPERFSVRGRIAQLRKMLRAHDMLTFSSLFVADTTKDEIIATFLALLEIVNAGEVRLVQRSVFEEIEIIRKD